MKTAFLLLLSITASLAETTPMKKTFTHEGFELNYQSFRLGDEGAKTPLVLFLHGAGERGDDNMSQLKHGMPELIHWLEKTDQACEVIAPQCPAERWWADYTDMKDPEKIALADKPGEIMSAVLELVKARVDAGEVDADRVYITGLSMGGFGTFAAVSYQPQLFAAAIPICGGGDPSKAESLKHLPMAIIHGDDDPVVPVGLSRKMKEALEGAGANVNYTEMMLSGHDSWTPAYRHPGLWEWMFRQKKASSGDSETPQ